MLTQLKNLRIGPGLDRYVQVLKYSAHKGMRDDIASLICAPDAIECN